MMPLTMAKTGQSVVIRRITGKDEVRQHLGELGFLPEETVTVVTELGGNLILSVKAVEDVDAAIEHINAHGTRHSEAILTRDEHAAKRFCDRVDAAAVYVNTSTRFTDGGEFGYGAEIGISTQKLHARGPMGLRALTTVKYVVTSDGAVRK